MKMSKITLKLNERLLKVINVISDQAQNELEGLVKTTHTVQFELFPGSLLVNCFFETQAQLDNSQALEKVFQRKLQKLLLKQGILLKESSRNLKFCLA